MSKRPSNIIFFIFIIVGLLYAKLFYVHFSFFIALLPIAILPLFMIKYRYIFLSVLLGMMLFNIHNMTFYYSDKSLEKFDDKNITIKGTVKEHKNYRFSSISIIEAENFYVGEENIQLPITVSTYSNRSHEYIKNDSIVISGKFQKYVETKNLYEKDEINIARNNKISGFISSPKIISHKSKFSVSKVIHSIRSGIINIFNDRLLFKSANFMNAIIIGSRESLEKGTIKEFSESGTIHLLAVSGLHVGFLLLVLIFFRKIFGYRINIHLVVVTTVLISYILLTGSSPSVIRAGIMSIIALLSFPMKRKIKILDVIATAGIFSLIIDPNQIFKLGFILSFTAVLSLVIIYKYISELSFVNDLILKAGKGSFIIKGIIVSVSASIGTLPIVLYYFGKFNVFSIFANVILIPITGFNYLMGIILLVINKVPILSDFIAFIIDTTVKIMLEIVSFVSDINFMKIIYKINIVELVVLLSLIVIIFIIHSYKIKIVLLSVIIVVIISSFFVNSTRNHIYCFSTDHGNSSFATLDGQNILFLGKLKGRELKNTIKSYLFANNVKRLDYIILLDKDMKDEGKISELDIPVGFIVSLRDDFISENHEVLNIGSMGNIIKLFNSRIYLSESKDRVMLAYSNNKILFGRSVNVNGKELNTENAGIIFLMKR